MPTAFVLINTEIGSEADVLKDLKKVEGVDEAFAVYGVYDIIARVKADTMDKVKEIVTWRIRRLDKVRSTLTMIVVEDSQNKLNSSSLLFILNALLFIIGKIIILFNAS